MLAIIRAHAAEATPPNKTTAYNDGNFVLLGLVIEKVTGQTVHDHLTGLIGELGLTSTSYPTGNALPEPYVTATTAMGRRHRQRAGTATPRSKPR